MQYTYVCCNVKFAALTCKVFRASEPFLYLVMKSVEHRFGEKFRETLVVFVDLAVGGVEPELRGLRDEDRDVGAGRGLEVEGRGAVLEKPETSVL